MEELALFAEDGEGEFFGSRLEEDCCVVAEDAREDHYNGDGEEDPVARFVVSRSFVGILCVVRGRTIMLDLCGSSGPLGLPSRQRCFRMEASLRNATGKQ